MLSKERLTNSLKVVFSKASTENNIDEVAGNLADAIIAEIKNIQIDYTTGLTAPNGIVAGKFNYTIT